MHDSVQIACMATLQVSVIWFNTVLAVLLPLVLWWRGKREWLLLWIIFTCFTDIIGNQVSFNFSGYKMAGLVLIPLATRSYRILPAFLRKGIAFYLAWNFMRGAFAFDIGRFAVVKQLGTQVSDISIALVVVGLIRELGIEAFARNLIRSVAISLFGMAVELALQFDTFRYLTGGRPGLFLHRVRGFSYEPRAAGYSMAVGMVVAVTRGFDRTAIILLVLAALGLGLTGSISSLALAGLGLGVALLPRLKSPKVVFLAMCAGVSIGLAGPWGEMFQGKYEAFWSSVSPEVSLLDFWIQINETSDSSTLNYLKQHPISFWLGMGPGAQAVLATQSLLPRDLAVWGGAETLPLPGFGYLLILSNLGIFGLIFYCWVFWIKPFLFIEKRGPWFYFSLSLFCMFLLQSRNLHSLGLGVLWWMVCSRNENTRSHLSSKM
jgi:hypothetical protein